MKELSTEEKAKIYNKVREKIALRFGSNVAEEIFSEFEETDDERIRKDIIAFIKKRDRSGCDYDYDKWIAWLEKQGVHLENHDDEDILQRFSFYSYKDEPNIIYLSGLYVNAEHQNKGIGTKILSIADEVAVRMGCNVIRLKTEIGSNAERLYRRNGYNTFQIEGNQVWLEKQGEQKPYGQRKECLDCQFNYAGECKGSCQMKRDEQKSIDKVVPKFKVGDFIVNDYCAGKVIALTDDAYLLDTGQGIPFSYEYNARLWTIQDAKPGDVLATDKSVFIYAKTLYNKPYAYCGVDKYGVFKDNCLKNNWANSVNNILPANKEQRDTLMKAMADAGYTFDFEKKELKKIEKKSQRTISAEAKEALYDKPTDEEMKELLRTEYEKGRADTIAEMKSSWSEKDEKILNNLIDYIKVDDALQYSEKQVVDWLKSIKQRIGG